MYSSLPLQFEFVDFSLTEIVFIEFYTENITSPDGIRGIKAIGKGLLDLT